MECSIASNNEEDFNNIWEIANNELELLKIQKDKKLPKKNICNHITNFEGICIKCGGCINIFNICREGEWNNYKDDSGNYTKNSQRADTYNDGNPYSVGGTLLPNHLKNTLAGKIQIQSIYSHKQKTYWNITNQIEHAAILLKINNRDAIEKAKNYWYKYMESGKLTRASVRKGLIAACLFYSCVKKNIPIERQEIIKTFECDTKTLSKGEKVLFEILESDNLTYINIQTEESNSFIRYCSLLKLKFNVSTICNEIHEKYKIELQAVTPKSAVGGIICYVIKYKLNLKAPTKTVISATVDVCTPTLNKVIQLILDLENNY